MAKEEFLGGKVPAELKREFQARAVSEDRSMNALLVDMVQSYLTGEAGISKVDTDKIISGLKEELESIKLPAGDVVVDDEAIEKAVKSVLDNMADSGLIARINELEKEVSGLETENSIIRDNIKQIEEDMESLNDGVSYLENNMPEIRERYEEIDDFEGWRKLMAEEVNCLIVRVYEGSPMKQIEDQAAMLRRISRQLEIEVEDPRSGECRINFKEIVPDEHTENISRIIQLAILDMEENEVDEKGMVFGKLSQMFWKEAELVSEKQRAVTVSFDEESEEAISDLMESLQEEGAPISDKKSFLKYLVAKAMLEEGQALFSSKKYLAAQGKRIIEELKSQ
jgi:uncharacterized protein (DUF2164 family)